MPLSDMLGRVRRKIGGQASNLPQDYDTAWALSLIRRSEVFFDAGCNVGHLTAFACQNGPQAVVAVDANTAALAEAARRVFETGASLHVRFCLGFLGAADGEEVEFFTVGTGAAGSRYEGHAVTASKAHSSFMIPTIRLDTVCAETGLQPDLVKIDVEGAEHDVLLGAVNAAANGARFFVEMHSPPELPMLRNAGLVLDWCQQHDYTAHYLKEHRALSRPDEIAHRGRCHLLLLPSAMPYPDHLREIDQNAPAAMGLSN